MTYIPYRLIKTPTLDGRTVDMLCPSFCTEDHGVKAEVGEAATVQTPARDEDGKPGHVYDHVWHCGPSFKLNGPGDMFCQDDPQHRVYPVLHASLSAEPLDDGTFGQPYIYLDTLDAGQGGRLDVEHADQLIRDLKVYTARLQDLRDQLARLTGEGEQ